MNELNYFKIPKMELVQTVRLDDLTMEEVPYIVDDLNEVMNARLNGSGELVNYGIKAIYVQTELKTVVIKWLDGDVTVAKADEHDQFNVLSGIAIAVSKKALGSTTDLLKLYDNAKIQKKRAR